MTPEEMNESIFKSQGWTNVKSHWRHLDGRRKWGPNDYYHSLDAIVPVVRAMPDARHREDVLTHLRIIREKHGEPLPRGEAPLSTPAQWCKAYLRAKGLWKP